MSLSREEMRRSSGIARAAEMSRPRSISVRREAAAVLMAQASPLNRADSTILSFSFNEILIRSPQRGLKLS